MDRIKSYDDDDMNNFAFEKADEEVESDEKLLDEWNVEGPDLALSPGATEAESAEADEGEGRAELDPQADEEDDDGDDDDEDDADGDDDDEEDDEEEW